MSTSDVNNGDNKKDNRFRTWPIPLQPDFVYGPINSKRLGRSLGINLSGPEIKLCNYNCVYCFYGPTVFKPGSDLFPPVEKIIKAVDAKLKSNLEIDWLTFSGNGESTIHPEFADIVSEIKSLIDKHRPGLPLAMLSNGSAAYRDEIVETIDMLDLTVLKLDAGNKNAFRRINRPLEGKDTLDKIIEGLRNIAKSKSLVMQSVIFDGEINNCRDSEKRDLIDTIEYIAPAVWQTYSLDAPTDKLLPVDPPILEDFAVKVSKKGIKAEVYIEENT